MLTPPGYREWALAEGRHLATPVRFATCGPPGPSFRGCLRNHTTPRQLGPDSVGYKGAFQGLMRLMNAAERDDGKLWWAANVRQDLARGEYY